GVIGMATAPRSAKRSLSFGSKSTVLISRLSLSMMPTGVFLGAPTPNQPLDSKPGMNSPTVGTSGNIDDLVVDVTANARNLPIRPYSIYDDIAVQIMT